MDYSWVFIAAVVSGAFVAGRWYERETVAERCRQARREEIVLGEIGPYAGAVVEGLMTAIDAEKKLAAFRDDRAVSKWRSMDDAAIHELGERMNKLHRDPKYRAMMDPLIKEAKEMLENERIKQSIALPSQQ